MRNELREEFESNPSLVSIKSSVWFRVKFCIQILVIAVRALWPGKPWNVWLMITVGQNVIFHACCS